MFRSKSKPETVSDQVRAHASELAGRLSPHVENAKDKAGPLVADARAKSAPVIADARKKAAPVVADARTRWEKEVVPSVTAAVTAASEASEPYREEAMKRAQAAGAALKGEVAAPKPKKKKRRLRRFVTLLGLAGIAAAVAKKLSDREPTTTWQSAPEPSPVTEAAPVAGTGGGKHVDDEAASSPDEALADAEESPHRATDPDHPVEEVDVKKT